MNRRNRIIAILFEKLKHATNKSEYQLCLAAINEILEIDLLREAVRQAKEK